VTVSRRNKRAKRYGKEAERAIARLLDGQRVTETGRHDGKRDITTPYNLCVDVKSRKSLSPVPFEMLAQAAEKDLDVLTDAQGLVVCSILDLREFALGVQPGAWWAGYKSTKRIPGTIVNWLDNVSTVAEPDELSCVILHRKGTRYTASVVVARLENFRTWLKQWRTE